LVANQCQNQDLYWAIRGGGGGTFGVITKLTVKAYPAPKLVIGAFDIRAKHQTSEDQFYKVIAHAHALFPAIQDAGIHGYYTVTGPPEAEALTFSGSFMGFDTSNKTYDNALEPFRKMLEASNSTVTWSLTKIPVSTWQGLLKVLPNIGTVRAGYGITTSRLISRQTVTEKTEEFAAVYKKIGPTREAPLVQKFP
jgi:FAD/FMN-containing dehydrogenase